MACAGMIATNYICISVVSGLASMLKNVTADAYLCVVYAF